MVCLGQQSRRPWASATGVLLSMMMPRARAKRPSVIVRMVLPPLRGSLDGSLGDYSKIGKTGQFGQASLVRVIGGGCVLAAGERRSSRECVGGGCVLAAGERRSSFVGGGGITCRSTCRTHTDAAASGSHPLPSRACTRS